MLQTRKPRFQEASELMSAGPMLGAFRVGAELRAARQRLGWAMPDVARALRIRVPYLEAIEAGRLDDLPGNAYAVGFLQSYARALGLNPGEVARRYRAEVEGIDRKPDLAFPAPVPKRGVPAGAVVLLGLLIAAGTYAGWYGLSAPPGAQLAGVPPVPDRFAALAEQPSPAPPSPSPSMLAAGPEAVPPAQKPPRLPAPPSDPVAAVAAETAAAAIEDETPKPAEIVLRFDADAWVQVRRKQGTILLSRVMRPGETWPVPQGESLLMTTGNAGGTEIVVDGVPRPALGPSGAVKRDIPLGPDAPVQQAAGSTAQPLAR